MAVLVLCYCLPINLVVIYTHGNYYSDYYCTVDNIIYFDYCIFDDYIEYHYDVNVTVIDFIMII